MDEWLSISSRSGVKTFSHTRSWLLSQTAMRTEALVSYLSNTLTNLCIALYCILLYSVVLNCIVLLIYCYVDIIQYNAMHKFVGVLDNPHWYCKRTPVEMHCN